MQYSIQPREINNDKPFEGDLFNREEFAKNLFNIANNTQAPLVIALDAPWGEGKTIFSKMFQGYAIRQGAACLYYDAFANDFQKDAFYSLSGELYNALSDDGLKKSFKKKASQVFKIFVASGVRTAIKIGTAGFIDEKMLKDVSSEMVKAADDLFLKGITQVNEEKKTIEDFKNFLSSVPKGSEKPYIVIIDELDRCKPPNAVELIEVIKHFFSVPGIVFILSVNRVQLERAINGVYGSVDSTTYLEKFINLWAKLPKKMGDRDNDIEKYSRYCLTHLGLGNTPLTNFNFGYFIDLIKFYQPSLRQVERIVINFQILAAAHHDEKSLSYHMGVFLAVIKVTHHDIYDSLKKGRITYNDLINRCDLLHFSSDSDIGLNIDNLLRLLLEVAMSPDEAAKKIITVRNLPPMSDYTFEPLFNILDSFKI